MHIFLTVLVIVLSVSTIFFFQKTTDLENKIQNLENRPSKPISDLDLLSNPDLSSTGLKLTQYNGVYTLTDDFNSIKYTIDTNIELLKSDKSSNNIFPKTLKLTFTNSENYKIEYQPTQRGGNVGNGEALSFFEISLVNGSFDETKPFFEGFNYEPVFVNGLKAFYGKDDVPSQMGVLNTYINLENNNHVRYTTYSNLSPNDPLIDNFYFEFRNSISSLK